MCPLLAEAIARAVRDRDFLRSPIDLALFGAAADAAEEDEDSDLARGLRSGLCPDNWDGNLCVWSRASDFAISCSTDLDNVPDAVFSRFPQGEKTKCRLEYPTWRDAFRALGRAMREAEAAVLTAEVSHPAGC